MIGRLGESQHRGHARVGAGKDRVPFGPGPGRERRRDATPQGGVLPGDSVEAEQPAELGEELRLKRADRHPLPVGRLVHVVPGHAAVQQVRAAFVPPQPGGQHAACHRAQRHRAVHDGGVHHLAAPGPAGRQQRGQHSAGEVERSAAEVTDDVQRHGRRPVMGADGMEHPRYGQVCNVVPGGVCERSVLTPARHPPVHQPGVAGEAVPRPDPQPLGDAGPEPLDQHVRAFREVERRPRAVRRAQVEYHRPFPAPQKLSPGHRSGLGSVDAYDVRTHIRQHHRAKRRRADPRELHHSHSVQRPIAHTPASREVDVTSTALYAGRCDIDRRDSAVAGGVTSTGGTRRWLCRRRAGGRCRRRGGA